MPTAESGLVIIDNKNCPLYALGDEFEIKGRSVFLHGKPACLTLMDDIMQTIEYQMRHLKPKGTPDASETFACSGQWTGCTGSIRLGYHKKNSRSKASLKKIEEEIEAVSGKLGDFSIFQSLSEPEIKEIVSFFRIKQFSKDEIILKKGEPGVRLYIILSGEVEVLGDYDIHIATLSKGEIFGEMSLLSGNPVNSTIKVAKDAKLMFMNGNQFRMMLNRFPSLQMYFAKLLVDRLAKSNEERSLQMTSGMSGSFTEISPAELFQTLNMTEKTGVLNLYLADGNARISFRNGDIITADYNKMCGKDAFFEIVKQVRGNFKFEPDLPTEEKEAPVLGDFMFLLIEGLNRADEESFRGAGR